MLNKKNQMFNINNQKTWEKELISNILYSFVFAVLITLIIFWLTFISSEIMETSMQPTLNKHGGNKSDIVYMNKFKKSIDDVENGDIVIVKHNGEWLIKRVIASKGDYINFKQNNNGAYEVYVNGEIIQEDYVKQYNNLSNYNGMVKEDKDGNKINPLQRLYNFGDNHFGDQIPDGFEYPDYVLEDNEMFIMGDNRLVSISDSRDNGAFSENDLVGIVKYIKKYEESSLEFYFRLLFSNKVETMWA